MLRCRWVVVVATLLLGPLTARAHAAAGMTLGFSSDPALTDASASANEFWIPRAVIDGARIVRLNVAWSQVAPSRPPLGFRASDPGSPGYRWASTDAAVRELAGHGLSVLITIWDAPAWAEGPDRPSSAPNGTWKPSASQFGAFAQAMARRYDGSFPDPQHVGQALPRVRYWQAWNEPNLNVYLNPQWSRAAHHWVAESAIIYRGLLNAFYGAVKRVAKTNFVVTAGTAPYGDLPGGLRVPPVMFDRTMFCLSPELTATKCPNPPHLDALSHHPYGIGGPLWHALNAGDVAVPDIYKLARVLHAAERVHHVLPRGHKRLWVTEISWDSNPPDPQAVPIQRQAHWLEQAMYVLWRQGVHTVLWLQIVDSPCIPNCGTTYQAGLYYLNGSPKPAATAYRFPFVTRRLNPGRVQIWGRVPSAGKVFIERRVRGHWKRVRTLRLKRDAIFLTSVRVRGKALLEARISGQNSLPWMQGA